MNNKARREIMMVIDALKDSELDQVFEDGIWYRMVRSEDNVWPEPELAGVLGAVAFYWLKRWNNDQLLTKDDCYKILAEKFPNAANAQLEALPLFVCINRWGYKYRYTFTEIAEKLRKYLDKS